MNVTQLKALTHYVRNCKDFSKKDICSYKKLLKKRCSREKKLQCVWKITAFFAVLCVVCEGLYIVVWGNDVSYSRCLLSEAVSYDAKMLTLWKYVAINIHILLILVFVCKLRPRHQLGLFYVFRERAAELEKSWEGLKEATDKKTRGLNEAVEEQQYNRNIGMRLIFV